MSSIVRVPAVIILVAISSIYSFGQDLGSSNKLFGGTSNKSTPSTTKKSTNKKKAAPTKTKSQRKSTTAASKSNKTGKGKSQEAAKTKPGATAPAKDVKATSNAAADGLFEKLIEDGNAARDDRNYTAGEIAYQRAKKLKPRDARAVFGLGNLYSDQQLWDEAESAYRAALQLDPGNVFAHIALSYVLSQPIMVPNLSERYEEAERLARRSTELDPRNALAFDQLGVAMELRGIISAETENAYRNAIRLAPPFAPSYAHLGRLLRRRGLTKESADAYKQAIQLSTDVATMVIVADVMQSEQRFAESETLLIKAIELDPRNPTGLLLLGRALTTLGRFADAEKYLRKSLDVSPNGFISNCLLGSLYERQGKLELAENALMQALRSVSANEKRRLSLQFESVGDSYLKVGKSQNAERVYKQAKTLDADNESLAAKLTKAGKN